MWKNEPAVVAISTDYTLYGKLWEHGYDSHYQHAYSYSLYSVIANFSLTVLAMNPLTNHYNANRSLKDGSTFVEAKF
jgi:hypothetical protein